MMMISAIAPPPIYMVVLLDEWRFAESAPASSPGRLAR
jgi:hypothetical protein